MATAKVLNACGGGGQEQLLVVAAPDDPTAPVVDVNVNVDMDKETKRCRMCHSTALHIDWAQGDRVCTNCGIVDEEHLLDDRPEWREFSEADDLAKNGAAGGSSAARCGLVVVDESMYWGGLQPTTLSKQVFGGGGAAAAAAVSQMTRKRLMATSRRIDHRMEKLSARSMEAVRLHRKILQKKNKAKKDSRQRLQENGGDDDDDDDDDRDYDEDDDQVDSSLRPEYEQLLLQEEEDATRVRAALYADKWSLQRAIQIFGTQHEVSLLGENNHRDSFFDESSAGGEDSGSGSKRLDATLKQASQDLYRAYSMLLQSATQLHLPERVKGEAVSLLCRYAARRDGLSVRGVSSTLKMRGTSSSAAATATTSPRQEKMARSALGDYNKMKQAGALCSALIFYSCRTMGWPRPLEEVCASVKPFAPPPNHSNHNNNNNYDKLFLASKQEDQFIKKKHCSRAMSEVKEIFPDLVQNAAAAAAAAPSSSSSSANGVKGGATVVSSPLSSSLSSSSKTKPHISMNLINLVDHKLRSLHLPPVAEAVVRSLVCYWQQQNQQQQQSSNSTTTATPPTDELSTTNKLSTLCAALTLFVCHMGAVMQRLASHASKSKKRKAAIMTEQQQHQVHDKKQYTSSPEISKRIKTSTAAEAVTEESSSSSSSFDVFDNSVTVDELSAEQRAYEMGRVWDAWREQTPWSRSLAEVEQSCRVSGNSILEFYRKRIYPERTRLLQRLKDSVATTTVARRNMQEDRGGAVDDDDEVFTSLKGTPLSSVLLPQIHVVSSLLNEDAKLS